MSAGFHSAALYHALRGAVKPLTELLTDDEYKTRANAAGALGNLVRNSSMLCEPIVQAGALQVTCTCVSALSFCSCSIEQSRKWRWNASNVQPAC